VVVESSLVSEVADSPPAALMDEPPDGAIPPTATTEETSSAVTSPPTPDSAGAGEHKVVTVLCGGVVDATDWAWIGETKGI
jgi:hypothetical protein